MKRPIITKAQARAYCRRWRIANEREVDEMRTTSIDTKMRQLVTLMEWARYFEWSEDREREVAEVRARWAKLRKVLGD